MSNVQQRLRMIREGVDINSVVKEDSNYGDKETEALEEATFELIQAFITESNSEVLKQILVEGDARDPGALDIIFKRIRDYIRGGFPSNAIKDLEVVRERFINKWLMTGISIPLTGIIFAFVYVLRRLLKMKNMTKEEAKKAIAEAEKVKDTLEKVAQKLYKEGNNKKAEKIKAQIREIDIAIGEFMDKYSVVLGKSK